MDAPPAGSRADADRPDDRGSSEGGPAAAEGRDLADVPAVEVITRAAVMLMSATAEKLGLGPDADAAQRLDLDEARRLLEALAGLVRASEPWLGMHRGPLRDGLRALQAAFREASPYPDPPGAGPGEHPR